MTWLIEDGGWTGDYEIRLLTFDSAGKLVSVSAEIRQSTT